MEYKSISGDGIKDLDVKHGIISGYLSAFNIKDREGDIVERGAFAKTIAENGPLGTKNIRYLLDHKRDQNVGVFTELKEDSYGLAYVAKAGRHALGRDYLMMVEDGIIKEHSYAYRRIKQDKRADGTYLKELMISEGSGLQIDGANPHTPITGIKSYEDIADYLVTLNKALRDGNYTDEGFKAIQEQIGSITVTLESLNPTKAGSTTLDVNEPNILTGLINVLKNN